MGISLGDFLLLIIGSILFILALIVLITNIMHQLYFFTLDPGRAASLDISMRILSSLGTPGNVIINYENITSGITYTFSNSDRIFCVFAVSKLTDIWAVGCSSLPFKIKLKNETESFLLRINKTFNPLLEIVEVDAEWLQ